MDQELHASLFVDRIHEDITTGVSCAVREVLGEMHARSFKPPGGSRPSRGGSTVTSG